MKNSRVCIIDGKITLPVGVATLLDVMQAILHTSLGSASLREAAQGLNIIKDDTHYSFADVLEEDGCCNRRVPFELVDTNHGKWHLTRNDIIFDPRKIEFK